MNKYLLVSLSIAILLIFVYTLLRDSLNFPSFDDYEATLNFIKQFYFENQSLSGRLEALFSKHNEHQILISKIASATYFAIFKEINFAHLVIFQNIFLLGFFGIIISLFKNEKQLYPQVFLVITAFLFSFSFWQVSFYYWAGIQHYTVFFFSFLSLIVLDKTQKAASFDFFLAILLALFAVFSFGNGFLVLLMGVFLLFVQKKYPMLITWLIISCILIFITFFAQKQINQTPHGILNIEWMARLLFTFLGSFLYINPPSGHYFNIVICMIAGATILIGWIFLFFSGYAFKKPLLYSLLSLPVLTGIIISISRFETKAAGGVAPRYMFFTAVIPIMLLLILLDLKVIRTNFLQYLTIAVVLLWGLSFYNNSLALKSTNTEIALTVQKWKSDNNTRLIYYMDPERYSAIMQWAVSHHVVNNPVYKASREEAFK